MPRTEPQRIKINSVQGGKDKDDLKKLFFLPNADGTYDLYQRNEPTLLRTGITTGGSFKFKLPGSSITWTVPDPNDATHPFHIDPLDAGGSWRNDDNSASIGDEGDGESGTFTAQAGPSLDPVEASAAKA